MRASSEIWKTGDPVPVSSILVFFCELFIRKSIFVQLDWLPVTPLSNQFQLFMLLQIITQIYDRKSAESDRLIEVAKKLKGRRRASLHGCNFFGSSTATSATATLLEEGSVSTSNPATHLTRFHQNLIFGLNSTKLEHFTAGTSAIKEISS